MSTNTLGCFLIVLFSFTSLASYQDAPATPKPDSPEVLALIQKAKQTGGARWAEEAHFFCEAPRANSAMDPVIAPTKIFDNVYAIGNSGTTVYVVQTSAGLLMFDSLGANQVETQLLPGFRALGLDPAKVKAIVVGHGHADHFGGSQYMQEHYGSKVYIAAVDWDSMERPAGGRQGGAQPAPVREGAAQAAAAGRQGGPQAAPPKRDQIVAEGQPIVLGDLTVTPVAIPGHTPGSMGYIFPVKDNGRTHMAAMYGGTILLPGRISDEGFQTYQRSIAHFKDETKKAKVDVELQNHPLMDPIQTKLDQLKARRQGAPNPFVVGEAEYQKFLDVMSQCMDVNIARRK